TICCLLTPPLSPYTTLFRSLRWRGRRQTAPVDRRSPISRSAVPRPLGGDVPRPFPSTYKRRRRTRPRRQRRQQRRARVQVGRKGDRKSTRLNSSHVKISYAV